MSHPWLPLLEQHTTEFASVLRTADLDAAVPGCPGWDLRALAQHLGWIHQWATHAVVSGDGDGAPEDGPHGREPLLRWYAASAHALCGALREAGDGPAWTLGPPHGRASFWQRRQVHETRLHLWDARTSQGLADPIDPDLAWDGVREVAEVFYPRQLRLGRTEPLPVALHLTDGSRTTVLGEGAPCVVEAAAADLLLMLWHRAPAPPHARHLLAGALAP